MPDSVGFSCLVVCERKKYYKHTNVYFCSNSAMAVTSRWDWGIHCCMRKSRALLRALKELRLDRKLKVTTWLWNVSEDEMNIPSGKTNKAAEGEGREQSWINSPKGFSSYMIVLLLFLYTDRLFRKGITSKSEKSTPLLYLFHCCST